MLRGIESLRGSESLNELYRARGRHSFSHGFSLLERWEQRHPFDASITVCSRK